MFLMKKMYQAFYQSLILVGTSSQVGNYKNTITLLRGLSIKYVDFLNNSKLAYDN